MKKAKETTTKNTDITERKRKEEEASRMVTVVRDSNDAITIQDFEGHILAWNRGAELMYGYSEEEALQKNIWLLTPSNRAKEQKDFTRRLIAGEKITSLETQRETKDGRILDVWMTVTKLVDDTGKPIGIASTERDITERKRKEEEANRMVTVVRDSNDAITIQDFEGHILAWNRGAELMFGYSEKEALKMTIWQLAPPDKAAEQKDFNRRIFAGEKVVSFETQRVTKDDRILDIWMTVTKLMDDAGKVIGIASTERDITERKKREVELAAAHQLYQELFANVNVAIVRSTPGPEGTFVDVNPAMVRMFEADNREQVLAMHPSQIYWDESQRKIISDAIVARGLADEEIKFKTLKGNPLWCHITSAKRTDASGQVYFDSTMEDFTDRKQAEDEIHRLNASLERRVRERTDELQASNMELESFAYSVSHDLRAPLRTIDGFSHALLEDYEGKLDEQGKDYLRRVRASTQMMGQLIDDILKISRITRTEMNIEKADLTQIAWSVIDELQKSQPERLINIKIADGLEDSVDPKLMRIALENLLGNSWKFTGKRAEAVIEFGATKEGGKKVYFIRDNGAGFDMAYADKLFAPFQRLHTMEEYPGTGIGLATVQRVIHRHGGKAWAEGQVGKGATFYFSLQG